MSIGVAIGALIHGACSSWWTNYKKRHTESVTLVKRDGVWQPSRIIPIVERVYDWSAYIGLAGIAFGLFSLVYCRLKGI